MKFAHLADVHVGSWADPKLRDISTNAFLMAMDLCIGKNVDFILIAGDLFNSAIPDINSLKVVVEKLRHIKESDIPVYMIGGSHDFSASGKTMLHVLEKAGLVIDVHKGEVVGGKLRLKFTTNIKTGAKITGILGKKGMLEKHIYEDLDRTEIERETEKKIEEENSFKIFMFHTALTEFKPKGMEKMESSPLELLPKGFDYYAGGHVHYILEKDLKNDGFGKLVYPGALFPANFKELEEFKKGGFYIYEDGRLVYEPIELFPVKTFEFDCSMKTPQQIEEDVKRKTKDTSLHDAIVLMRFHGKLGSGRVSDIDFNHLFDALQERGAYFIMRNTSKLTSTEFEAGQIRLNEGKSTEEIELNVIKEYSEKLKAAELPELPYNRERLTAELIKVLSIEKDEGEKNPDFERRVKDEARKVLEVEKVI